MSATLTMSRTQRITAQHDKWREFLHSLDPAQREHARTAMMGYVIGDVPPTVFEEALAYLRDAYRPEVQP